jgi:hypothetical protein
MTIEGEQQVEGGAGVRAASINFAPTSRVTAPEVTDWHLVADHELDSIAHPEAGITGAIGFAALGAALGAMPSGCTALDNISNGTNVPPESFRSLMILLPAIAAALICLAVWGISKWRNAGLVTRIRARPKRNSAQDQGQ